MFKVMDFNINALVFYCIYTVKLLSMLTIGLDYRMLSSCLSPRPQGSKGSLHDFKIFWTLSSEHPLALLQSSILCAMSLSGSFKPAAACSIRLIKASRRLNLCPAASPFLHLLSNFSLRYRIDGDRIPSGPLMRPLSHSSHASSTVCMEVLTLYSGTGS